MDSMLLVLEISVSIQLTVSRERSGDARFGVEYRDPDGGGSRRNVEAVSVWILGRAFCQELQGSFRASNASP